MMRKFFNWFSKSGQDEAIVQLPPDQDTQFILMGNDLHIGTLYCEKGEWFFKYADIFKLRGSDYNLITGFPDVSKTYRSATLWPFFKIRIPGLKQPAIQEILKNENIATENEVELLKRFGQKSISNPYELVISNQKIA